MFLIHPDYKNNLTFNHKLYYAFFGKAFARKSLSIITDSEHAKNDIIKLWKVNPRKIFVIPLGLAKRYRPIENEKLLNQVKKRLKLPGKYILYLGNFKPHKNVPALIQAYKHIEKKFPDYKLVLAGTLDEHGIKTKDYVTSQGLKNKVLFTDTVREKDCPEAIYSMADLFVFPTLYEGFGLPPLEAMACGTPVVASNLTSVPEVIGDAGILVNPMAIEELSDAISGLLKSPEKQALYSEKGLKRAKRFREKDTAGKLYEHIISLLEEIT
jgi:glycosyltransferase involved in cell wall biosynthesis